MFLQCVRIRSPCFAFLISSINLFSSLDNPLFNVLLQRDVSNGNSSSSDSFWISSRLFPWNWNSFFLISTFFLSLFLLLFAADPNFICAISVTFFRSSVQKDYQLFSQVVRPVGRSLVYQHAGGFHPREGGQLGSLLRLVQQDNFFLYPVAHAIFSRLS